MIWSFLSFGGGLGCWLFAGISFDGFGRQCFVVGLFLLESLILAQDERWRRA